MNIAIVQGRLTSTRLPRKIIAEIGGIPLVKVLFDRLSNSAKVDAAIFVFPETPEHDFLEPILTSHDISYVRGSEDNVASRFIKIIEMYPGENTLIRLTCDNPLIDPRLVDTLLTEFQEGQYDYVRIGPTFADGQGIEVFSSSAFEAAYPRFVDDEDFEHVTTFFKKHPEKYSIKTMESPVDESNLRYTVDYEDDLKLVRLIWDKLSPEGIDFSSGTIREFLFSNPEYIEINSGHSRRHLDYGA